MPIAVAGQRFGPWQAVHCLGRGGMGEVWLARRADALYDGAAAIKLLRDRDSASLAGRFKRERRLLARLHHPGIARLLDAGVADGQPYIVLEYCEGRPLADHVREVARSVEARVRLVLAIADAVAHAHSQLIIHRDLKPSNVLVGADGSVKLLDFGIAGLLDDDDRDELALTRLYGRGLTVEYAAPEQITGEQPASVAADVWSLGVLLFELLAGERPHRPAHPGRQALEHVVLHDAPPRLSSVLAAPARSADVALARPIDAELARGDLSAIVAQALKRDPAERYTSVAALAADLQRWLAHEPISVRADDWRHATRLWLRRNRAVAALTAAVVLSLAAGLTVSLWQAQRAALEARRKDAVQQFLIGVLSSPDPYRGRDGNPTVRSVIAAGVARVEHELAHQPDVQLPVLRVLARTYFDLGDFTAALGLLDKAWTLHERIRNGDEAQEGDLLALRAGTLYELSRYAESARDYARAITALTAAHGPDSSEVAEARINLALSYTQIGRIPEALALARDAIRIYDEDPEARHREVALIRHSYALTLLRAGLLAEAEAQARLALQAAERRSGPLSGETGVSLQRLSTTLLMRGRYDEAEGVIRRAIDNLRQTLPGHPFFAFALQNQAFLLQDRHRPREALVPMREAITVFGRSQGEGSSNVLLSRLYLAEMLAEAGDRDAAKALVDGSAGPLDALPPPRRSFGLIAVGNVLLAAGQPEAALSRYRESLALRLSIYGDGHHYVAKAWQRIGLALAALGRDDEARAAFDAAEPIYRQVFNADHVDWIALRAARARLRPAR